MEQDTGGASPAPATGTAVPAAPAVGGSRTLAQLEALARHAAGHEIDPAELAPCDRPKAAPATPAEEA